MKNESSSKPTSSSKIAVHIIKYHKTMMQRWHHKFYIQCYSNEQAWQIRLLTRRSLCAVHLLQQDEFSVHTGPFHQYIFNVYMKYRSQYEFVTDPITVGQKTSWHFAGVFRIAMIKSTTVWF